MRNVLQKTEALQLELDHRAEEGPGTNLLGPVTPGPLVHILIVRRLCLPIRTGVTLKTPKPLQKMISLRVKMRTRMFKNW